MNLDKYLIPAEEGILSSFFKKKAKPNSDPNQNMKQPDPRMKDYSELIKRNDQRMTSVDKREVDAERKLRVAEFKKASDLFSKINKANGSYWSELSASSEDAKYFMDMTNPGSYNPEDDYLMITVRFDGASWAKSAYPDKYPEWIRGGWNTPTDKFIIAKMNEQFELCHKTWNEFKAKLSKLNLQTIVAGDTDGDKYEMFGEIYFKASNGFKKAIMATGYEDPDEYWNKN